MLTQTFIYLPGLIGVFAIGLFVLVRSKRSVFRLYSIFSFSLGAWLLCQYFADAQIHPARVWLQIASILAFVLAVMFNMFVYAYPDREALKGKRFLLLILPALVLAPVSFSDLVIKDASYTDSGLMFQDGPLYVVQTYAVVVYMLVGLGILLYRIKHVNVSQRSQIYLLIMAFVVALLGNFFAGILFVDSTIWQVARPMSILVMLGIIAYTMIYQRLFDIRSYAVRTAAYLFAFSITAMSYVLIATVATRLLLHAQLSTGAVVYLAIVTLVVAAFFGPLKAYFNKLTNKLFYRDYYDPQDVLDQLSSVLVGTVDSDEIRLRTQEILNASIRPTSFSVLLAAEPHSPKHADLSHLMKSDLSVIAIDEIDRQRYGQAYKALRKMDASLAVRLRTKHEDLGFLIMGARRSGQLYSSADRRLLSLVADELALGLQNALRFKEIEQFNITLRDKIDEATRKLRSTNEKLRKLDETKDDFISMASHQLRTPLTSVKGYVSMVLDGDAGKITALQRKLLTQSFISSQRMVYLISDLLNVSRLKTGKFIIEAVPTNLADVIEEEIEQLQETAKGRNLELIYHKPEHFPTLMLDETKIRQVLMNFIDNAVYYTPSGGHITINLVDTGKTIDYTVVDDGIGVAKHEQHHLFSKFFRAHNAKRARPDGTGLGLFMAKKVIIAQGGAIIFKSQEGRGSTFGFTFAKERLLPPKVNFTEAAKPNAIHINTPTHK